MTYRTTLDILFKSARFVPNYRCGVQNYVMGAIGGLDRDTSAYMEDILSVYKIPQFSYGSFVPAKNDKSDFPSFYRMVPNESLQYWGMVQLLLHFGWRWVGIITMDNEAGDNFLQVLEPMLSQMGFCSAFIARANNKVSNVKVNEFIEEVLNGLPVFMESTANVIVIYGEITSIIWLSDLLWVVERVIVPMMLPGYKIPAGKVWVITAQIDFTSNTYYKMLDIQPFRDGKFHGALSFAIHSNEHQGFTEFLHDLDPLQAKGDGFIKIFWEQVFSCSFPKLDSSTKNREPCSGEEELETLPAPSFEMDMTGHSYSIYNAVHALAHALHLMYSSGPRHRNIGYLGRLSMEPWQLHSRLLRISFNNSCGDEIRFNEHGELAGGFDITNLITLRTILSSDLPSELTSGLLDRKVPQLSICNDHCHPGAHRERKEEQKFCCYGCASCVEGMIADQEDMDYCICCPEDQYSSKNQDQCIPKMPSFLSFQEPLGITLTALTLFFTAITALVLGIFIKQRDTPIVKANNCSLTYLLLVSLLFCFLCSLLFIGEPNKLTCLLRQTAFGTIFSMAIASVLAKTITVIVAFMATKPGNIFRKWMGNAE
ncbi:vomeronasal type-2 receptor 116-like [Tiliqua scincoides]|uniref:vomeronasal type-2 receptor 116-like n=1 Tax=Tiliqua scincoides TaxID=71010 RepID=UPI003461C342